MWPRQQHLKQGRREETTAFQQISFAQSRVPEVSLAAERSVEGRPFEQKGEGKPPYIGGMTGGKNWVQMNILAPIIIYIHREVAFYE